MYEEVKESIIAHEGKVNMIYKDHLGNGTFGIGHLVLESDDLKPGVAYDDEKVMEIFEKDLPAPEPVVEPVVEEAPAPEPVVEEAPAPEPVKDPAPYKSHKKTLRRSSSR